MNKDIYLRQIQWLKLKTQDVNILRITPEIAKGLLVGNTSNRSPNERHVARLSEEMTNGKWKLNGDTIKLGKEKLIDGQHRLHAVIKSGISIESYVVLLEDDSVFNTIDIGKRRSFGDTLSVIGVSGGKNIAAALCFVDRYLKNKVEEKVEYNNNQIIELYKEHPNIVISVKKGQTVQSLSPSSIISGLHYLFCYIDEEDSDFFINYLKTGIGVEHTSPLFILRERLIANSISKSKVSIIFLAALMIKAWNAWRQGKKMSINGLRYHDSGPNKEDFPTISSVSRNKEGKNP